MAETIREMLEELEERTLHPRAARSARSRGRARPEDLDEERPAFQRDRDLLVHAMVMGHDLGHTPFGHAGERLLSEVVPGGFHHVVQSVRVVDVLENDGHGLNLTAEVRDGIFRHSKGRGNVLITGGQKALTLEAEIVRIADIVAYVNH